MSHYLPTSSVARAAVAQAGADASVIRDCGTYVVKAAHDAPQSFVDAVVNAFASCRPALRLIKRSHASDGRLKLRFGPVPVKFAWVKPAKPVKLAVLREDLQRLGDSWNDVRVSKKDGKLLITSRFEVDAFMLEALMNAHGYVWTSKRLRSGEIWPSSRGNRCRYSRFVLASESDAPAKRAKPAKPAPAAPAKTAPASPRSYTVPAAPAAPAKPARRSNACVECEGEGIDVAGVECWWCDGSGTRLGTSTSTALTTWHAPTTHARTSLAPYGRSTGFPAYTSKAKTSVESPIEAAHVATGTPGKLLVGFAPGKKQTNRWDRDVSADLTRLRDTFEVTHVACLIEDFEFEMLGMRDYAAKCGERGMMLHRYPIRDGGIGKLDAVFTLSMMLLSALERGENVYVHCKGGLGRAGTIAACVALLATPTLTAAEAIALVRAARSPQAIENVMQERFIGDFAALYGPTR
jgi:protein-tyrosine phosphatase